jgi:hypothetical protein
MQMRLRMGWRVPVIGEYLSAVFVIERVVVCARAHLPRASLTRALYDFVTLRERKRKATLESSWLPPIEEQHVRLGLQVTPTHGELA